MFSAPLVCQRFSQLFHYFHLFPAFSFAINKYIVESTNFEGTDGDDDNYLEENNFRSAHRDPITQAGRQKL